MGHFLSDRWLIETAPILVAINLASELLELKQQQVEAINLKNDLQTLNDKIDQAMLNA